MTKRLKVVVVALVVATLLVLSIAPASAGTCPIHRFITTQSCW